ncbi:zinc-dependent alcohol dehydrogenase family protein [Paraburkholderia hospita]|jgi:NADPH:quinone reductase-like Zn-dependent oxidoreductase|uniref:zinc-dependent alcohol dehydrogenase family protein n=1 Tax=Paraburkholderia hospita TaxID=169430 RepID=UPI0003E7D437|nr:zinc-dependent alcohol dehydrogenase family protein [Paraburkholderia hospita]EUC12234.1 Trans-2-enoyl-CoA reductase (NADPH) [Burkholderia sp. BT03]SKC55917.1 NADPH:quinone reductase [Paraburkholderia hospita]
MRAIQNTAFGNPVETLSLVDLLEPTAPGPDEVLIAMEYAPINGNDLAVIANRFVYSTALPSVVGNEGVGRILQVGSNVSNVKVGDRVLPPLYALTWRERLTIPASGLFALPADVDPQQLAMLRINPVTAVLLLGRFVDLKEGDWIVQNAANSGIGRTVIALARKRGLRTVNFVRRPELVKELEEAGADVVLVDEPGAVDKARAAVGQGNVRLAIDGLSGSAAARLIDVLSQNGTLVSYAFTSGELVTPVKVLDLHLRGIVMRGIYIDLPEYQPYIADAIEKSAELMARAELDLPVAAVYPLAEYQKAVAHAIKGGKVLLDLCSSS